MSAQKRSKRQTVLPELTEQGNRTERFSADLVLYTLLFLITACGVYFCFYHYHKTLLINGAGNFDGLAQAYPQYSKIKHVLDAFLAGNGIDAWSWDTGLGASFFDSYKGKLTSPLTYLITAFPQKQLDIGYTVVTIFRQYLSGLTFLIFGREVSLDRAQRVLGSLCYAFAGWLIWSTIEQAGFTNATIFFPLLVMGADRILKGRSPLVFLFAEIGLLASGTLWSWTAALVIIPYYCIRYFHYHQGEGLPAYGRSFLALIFYGITGILIGSLLVISMLYTTTHQVTNTGVSTYANGYTLLQYLMMADGLYYIDPVFTPYSLIYAPVLVIALLPAVLIRVWKKSIPAILTVFFLIAGLFPVTGKIFNGFSYTVGRWYYILMFFMVWAAMECFSREMLQKRWIRVILYLWILLTGVWIHIGYTRLGIVSPKAYYSMLVGVGCGLLILILITLRMTSFRDRKTASAAAGLLLVLVLVCDITGAANMIFYPGIPGGSSRMDKYESVGSLYDKFEWTTERVEAALQEQDTDFFRSDSVDTNNDQRIARMKANQNIYWGNRSIYQYLSSISSGWLYFNKMMGNNAGYFDRTISYSNDNRVMLDYLMGVKYFLGDNVAISPGASEYAGYGFTETQVIDGVQILTSSHHMGLGTSYGKYITESELEAYAPLEREQVLMQAAVVSDKESADLSTVRHASPEEIVTEMEEYPVTLLDPDNVEFSGGAVMSGSEGGTIRVYGEEGEFDIELPEIENRQVILSFENFVRDECSYEDYLSLNRISLPDESERTFRQKVDAKSYLDNQRFRIYVTKGQLRKDALCEKGKNQGFNDVTDFNINLGYYENISGRAHIRISHFGNYHFDAIKVYAVPMDGFDRNAEELDRHRLNITSFENDRIAGTMQAEEDSILYLSILDYPGWHILIDGKEVKKLRSVNLAFTGAILPAGEHQIELIYRYPGLKLGIVLTAAGLVLLAAAMWVRRYKRMRQRARRRA
ncbi:MAG: YfhO family protein [Mogibacterium sp.]|nr:YfhO family protein [Mogibacterium sp.]